MVFAVKHAVATSVVVSGTAALAAASYFGLLAWAILANSPIGSPFAFPFMVLLALVASTLAVVFVFLPTTAFTEWICSRRSFSRFVQIPVATIVLVLYLVSAFI